MPAHRRGTPRIALARAGLAEARRYLPGVEAKPRPKAGAEAADAEILGVFVDPAPRDAPPARHLLGREQPLAPSRLLGRGLDQLGQAPRQRLDRLGADAQLTSDPNRLAAHRFLPVRARRTRGRGVPLGEWWAIRAAAISTKWGSSSMPTKRRPSIAAAAPVVPEPQKGSRTRPPAFVEGVGLA